MLQAVIPINIRLDISLARHVITVVLQQSSIIMEAVHPQRRLQHITFRHH